MLRSTAGGTSGADVGAWRSALQALSPLRRRAPEGSWLTLGSPMASPPFWGSSRVAPSRQIAPPSAWAAVCCAEARLDMLEGESIQSAIGDAAHGCPPQCSAASAAAPCRSRPRVSALDHSMC